MRRLRLSAKLALAIIPIGLVALLAAGFIAFTFLGNSEEQNETAHAATVTADAIATLNAVWSEEALARDVFVFGDDSRAVAFEAAKDDVDAALKQLEDSTDALRQASQGFFGGVAISAAEDVRDIGVGLDQVRAVAAPTGEDLLRYHDVADSILSLLPRTSSIVSDRIQARELSTAYFLAEGGQISLEQEQLIEDYRATQDPDGTTTEDLQARASLQQTLEVLEDEFGAWALRANQTANQMNAAILRYTRLPAVNIDTFPLARNENILTTSEQLADGVAAESGANAAKSESEALLVAGIAAGVLLIALLGAYAVIRSVVRRVRGVTSAAVEVSEVDLPNLVEALQNPREDLTNLQPTQIDSAGYDEVGDLAKSFTLLHKTLIEVASQQMDILRKGVSEIFVTLARRNRSLVDRQLALLDELESREEDPDTLGGYYKLDHLATRMRRNAESLLVLAGTEPTRIWSNPLPISEIIRAALGEVDDYQRVDIMALEPALVSGRAVADIAHLMSELLDNGTQYSSPADRVRVAGLFDPAGYMLTVSDSGIGMSDGRMLDLNQLLESPPVLGLALEPTLGMYVVARLASRHGIKVQLIAGAPGLTVRVMLPKDLIEAVKPDEEPPAPIQTKPPTFASPSSQPPALNGSSLAATEHQSEPAQPTHIEAVTSNGHVTSDDLVEDEFRTSAFPGSVKGKHEQPGRPAGVNADVDQTVQRSWTDEVAAPEADEAERTDDHLDSSPAETEPIAEEKTAKGLTRRIPGESLREEHFAHPDQAFGESDADEPMIDDEPVHEEPWWVAAEEKQRTEKRAASASPFEFWDSDFGAAEAEVEPEETPVPEDATDEAVVEPTPPVLSRAGLPVRTPGTSFKETEDHNPSAAASESGAMGIRSALASFEGGRNLAHGKDQIDSEEDIDTSGGNQQ